jgi:abortive infection bacteriophage resistance protein
MKFEKPALTVPEMIDYLTNRGMIISDEKFATSSLRKINYYRLSTYWYPHKIETDNGQYKFEKDLTIEKIIYLHDFDGELRRLVATGIEVIEIALRRSIATHLALSLGPFAHQDGSNFKDYKIWSDSIQKLLIEYQSSKEEFASHFKSKYSEEVFPPIWVSLELTTFGTLSHLFSNIKDNRIRNSIAHDFGLDELVFKSFVHHLAYVRNLCAHHARLWNRKFVITPKLPKKIPGSYLSQFNSNRIGRKQIFNTLLVMDYIITKIESNFDFMAAVEDLISRYQDVNTMYMGKLQQLD